MSLAQRLEEAASALPAEADAIRPANGDPFVLLDALDAEGAARVLAWLLAHAPDEGEELADAWLHEPPAAEILGCIDAKALPKAGRKVVRRLLHRAKSAGLEVASAAPKAEARVGRLAKIEETIPE